MNNNNNKVVIIGLWILKLKKLPSKTFIRGRSFKNGAWTNKGRIKKKIAIGKPYIFGKKKLIMLEKTSKKKNTAKNSKIIIE